jgi:hypothetical protein
MVLRFHIANPRKIKRLSLTPGGSKAWRGFCRMTAMERFIADAATGFGFQRLSRRP